MNSAVSSLNIFLSWFFFAPPLLCLHIQMPVAGRDHRPCSAAMLRPPLPLRAGQLHTGHLHGCWCAASGSVTTRGAGKRIQLWMWMQVSRAVFQQTRTRTRTMSSARRSIRTWTWGASRCAWSGARRATSTGRRAAPTAASAITAWRLVRTHITRPGWTDQGRKVSWVLMCKCVNKGDFCRVSDGGGARERSH